MKIIIPVAGKATRMRPHSYSKAKPLLKIAGKPILSSIIETLLPLHPEAFIIIHDHFNGSQIQEFLKQNFPEQTFYFALQEKALGTADAISKINPFLSDTDDILICFSDALFSFDLSLIHTLPLEMDGLFLALEVEDYQNYGVMLVENTLLTKIVEKSSLPISHLANVGIYYIRKGRQLLDHYIDPFLKNNLRKKREFFLTDAFQAMVEDKKKIVVAPVGYWYDTGTIPKILQTHAQVLQGKQWIGEDVLLKDSQIRANVSIGKGSKLNHCFVENSLIGENCSLESVHIQDSVIGDRVVLKKDAKNYNLGDDCSIW